MIRLRQTVVYLGAVSLLLVLSAVLQFTRDRGFSETSNDEEVLYVKSGEVMEKIALSYDAILADVYWVRAIQHYGRQRLKPPSEANFDQLYPLLDIATALDPLFTPGYRFGAIFLSEAHPGGAGRPDLAIELLKKGIARNPQKWDYFHDIGFIYYWNLHNYEQAAAWFKKGSNLPGAPWWMSTYAAVMHARGGDRQSSRVMWEQLAQSEGNDWLRNTARLRLAQLDALDEIDTLTRLVDRLARSIGRLPSSWEEMVGTGALRAIPLDPSGTPYTLVASTGDVRLAAWSKLQPLPTELGAAPNVVTKPVPIH